MPLLLWEVIKASSADIYPNTPTPLLDDSVIIITIKAIKILNIILPSFIFIIILFFSYYNNFFINCIYLLFLKNHLIINTDFFNDSNNL